MATQCILLLITLAMATNTYAQNDNSINVSGRKIEFNSNTARAQGPNWLGQNTLFIVDKDTLYISQYNTQRESHYVYWFAMEDIFIPSFSEPIRENKEENQLEIRGKGYTCDIGEGGNKKMVWSNQLIVVIKCDDQEQYKQAKKIVTTGMPEKVFNKFLDYEMGTVADEDKPLYNELKGYIEERQTAKTAFKKAEANAVDAAASKMGAYDGSEATRYAYLYTGYGTSSGVLDDIFKVVIYDRKTGEVQCKRSGEDIRIEAYIRKNLRNFYSYTMLSTDEATPKYLSQDNGIANLHIGGSVVNSKEVLKSMGFTSGTTFNFENINTKTKYYMDRAVGHIKDGTGDVLYTMDGQFTGPEIMLLVALYENL